MVILSLWRCLFVLTQEQHSCQEIKEPLIPQDFRPYYSIVDFVYSIFDDMQWILERGLLMPHPIPIAHLALTSNGVEGACAAASLLLKHPHARVQITSNRHLPTALLDLLADGTPDAIHICGIGYEGIVERLMASLAAVRKHARVVWYSGRGHESLSSFEKSLSHACKTWFGDCETDAEAVQRALHVPRNRHARFVLELAEEAAAEKKPRSELHRLWHTVIEASNHRFFFFGDETYNERMVRSLAGLQPLDDELKHVAAEFERQADRLYPLGSSKAMMNIRKEMGTFGPLPEPVLVQGPTGSGKELVARGLHLASHRPGRFVAMNCAVLGGNPQLAEDRLFGHVEGAFTSAIRGRTGAFEEAHQGTLFLDEIGELPQDVQSQLLRVLEEKTVRPVGSMETRKVDVRVVAATHRSLLSMVRDGQFREDLYYRLNVLRIQVPPLRERPDDMRSIAAHALREMERNGFPLELGKRDWEAIVAYTWPGNVRQFVNVLKRAAYLKRSVAEVLAAEDTPDAPTSDHRIGVPMDPSEIRPAQEVYAEYIRHSFALCGGNVTRASRTLRISANTLRKYLELDL